jgi:hypothetical protein
MPIALQSTNAEAFQENSGIQSQAAKNGVSTAVLVSAEAPEIVAFTKKNNLTMDFYIADDILLKTMVRSIPGLCC